MIWLIIGIIVIYIIYNFSKDVNKVSSEPFEVKFRILINQLNDDLLFYSKLHKVNQFEYDLIGNHGTLSLKIKYLGDSLRIIAIEQSNGYVFDSEFSKTYKIPKVMSENIQIQIAKSFKNEYQKYIFKL